MNNYTYDILQTWMNIFNSQYNFDKCSWESSVEISYVNASFFYREIEPVVKWSTWTKTLNSRVAVVYFNILTISQNS